MNMTEYAQTSNLIFRKLVALVKVLDWTTDNDVPQHVNDTLAVNLLDLSEVFVTHETEGEKEGLFARDFPVRRNKWQTDFTLAVAFCFLHGSVLNHDASTGWMLEAMRLVRDNYHSDDDLHYGNEAEVKTPGPILA